MSPSVYLYNETKKGFELYLGECSTKYGLSFFSKNAELCIDCLGATLYQKYGWATEKDIPCFTTVGGFLSFLEMEGDIGIIEFECTLPGTVKLKTHDDGECHFVFASKQECLSALKTAIRPQHCNMLISKLIENQGLYLTCSETGIIEKYSSFDQYLGKSS